MDREQLYEICLSQPETAQEYPFGPDLAVFKVAGKVFVIATDHGTLAINVKCDPDVALSLRSTYGSVTAMSVWPKHWNYIKVDAGEVPDNELSNWIEDSFDLVVDKLPKATKLRIQGQVRTQDTDM
jgi:predicted DNA-binding protein (MmcQ/YjbR family)